MWEVRPAPTHDLLRVHIYISCNAQHSGISLPALMLNQQYVQDVGSAACPHTGIRVQGLCQQPLPGCPDELVTLRPHPQHPTLAVSLDKVIDDSCMLTLGQRRLVCRHRLPFSFPGEDGCCLLFVHLMTRGGCVGAELMVASLGSIAHTFHACPLFAEVTCQIFC
jgi:hypothetical protein